MKRIVKAINEGVKRGLLQFNDDDQIVFNKNKQPINTLKYLQEYNLGDYVYKDPELGYNNTIGEKVAVCVNDEYSNELFMVLNHELAKHEYKWAKKGTSLYLDETPSFRNGYENTRYILENYAGDLKETIWEHLNENEYIPSIDELFTIEKTYKYFFDKCQLPFESWSSNSLTNIAGNSTVAKYIMFNIPMAHVYDDKNDRCTASVVLLKIK